MAGIFHLVSTLSVQEFAQALGLALPTAVVAPSRGALLLLDSPGFALRRRGWFLMLVTEDGASHLSLRRLNHRAKLTALSSARVPEAVHDIDHPPLRARLEAFMGNSRLIVVQSWQFQALHHECRNDDGKVECTLIAHQYHALTAGGSMSPVIVELLPKRGYEHETAAVARVLTNHLPCAAQKRDAFELLEDLHLAAAAAQCANALPLQQAPATTVLAAWLLAHHSTMAALVTPELVPQAEQLHALRVAMRHSRSLLRAYRDLLGRDMERHFQREFRWLSSATSRLRDLDVLHAALLEPAADYAGLDQHERKQLLGLLQRERNRDARRLQGVLAGRRYQRLRQTWPLALATLLNRATPAAPAISVVAVAVIGRALARLQRDIITIATDASPRAVHELRKQCKRVRYVVAPIACLYPREQFAGVQSGLRQLQSVLGESCDRYAQLALCEGHLWRRAKGHPAIRAAVHSARLLLRHRLAASEVGFVLGALHEFEAGRYRTALESLLKMPDL